MRQMFAVSWQDQWHPHQRAGETPPAPERCKNLRCGKLCPCFHSTNSQRHSPLLLLKASPNPSARLGKPFGKEEFKFPPKLNKAPEKRREKPQTVSPDCSTRTQTCSGGFEHCTTTQPARSCLKTAEHPAGDETRGSAAQAQPLPAPSASITG